MSGNMAHGKEALLLRLKSMEEDWGSSSGPCPRYQGKSTAQRRVPCLPTGLLIRNTRSLKIPPLWNISITLNKNPWPHSLPYSKVVW